MDEKQREHLESQLSAYLDNELSERERREVEALLAESGDARDLLAELRATIEVLRKLPRAKASEQLQEDLRGRLERDALLGHTHKQLGELGGGTEYVFGRRSLAAAAVIVLIFSAAYLMGPFSRTSSPGHDRVASRDNQSAAPSETTDGVHTEAPVEDLTVGKRDASPAAEEPTPPVLAETEVREEQPKEMLHARAATPAASPSVVQLKDLAESSKDDSTAASRPAAGRGDSMEGQLGQSAMSAARDLASQPSIDSGLAQIQVPGITSLPSASLHANKPVALATQTSPSGAVTTRPVQATSTASSPSE